MFIFEPKNPIRIIEVILAGWLILLALGFSVNAQHQHQSEEYAPAFEVAALPPPPLMTGIGTAQIKITNRSELTQKYFNRGLNLLHAFWDVEAYRAFREAVRHDETSFWKVSVRLICAPANSKNPAHILKRF